MVHVQFGVHQHLQGLSCQADFWLCGPQHVVVHGVVPLQGQDFAVLLVELHEVPIGPFFQLEKVSLDGSTTPWSISHPPSSMSPANLLGVHSAVSLMKMLNRIRPSINHRAPLLVTGLQLDFKVLVTTLWAQPFDQFSVHLIISLIKQEKSQ